MKIKKLFEGQEIFGLTDLEMDIESIKKDSRLCRQNDVFFDLSSNYTKSLENCTEAIKNGAKVVVSSQLLPIDELIKVKDVRESFALACKNFYNCSCDKLKIIGITGTNGKTTTSHIVAECLKYAGYKVGVIGTMGVFYDDKTLDFDMTTPDSDDLHFAFDKMVQSGVQYVVMEVSAHAIAQKRVHGINFEVGVLTNITQDHLDYFHTFENYADCKLSFFKPENMKMAVVCADDQQGQLLIENSSMPVISYGINNPADVFAVDIDESMKRSQFFCNAMDEVVKIDTNLIGQYNIENSLAGIGVCTCLGLKLKTVAQGLKFIRPVEGRFNIISTHNRNIIIDFAHTPDGLEKVLSTAKSLCKGKLYCIFGCGGNRDVDKRHKMGMISEKYCDYVCLTNDNPRFEEPRSIVANIEEGMTKGHMVELDRTEAIRKMLAICRPDDVLVIAGKGGEKYQSIGGKKIPYNDFDAVYGCLKKAYGVDIHQKEARR